MILEWKQPNLLTVCLPVNDNPSMGGTGFSMAAKILPGVNEIDDSIWAKVKDHHVVKHYVKDESLIVIERPAKDNKKSREGLAMYELDKAIKIVEKTFDHKLLEKWKSKESRQGVLSAMEAQFKKIEDTVKPKKDDNEDDDE